MILQPRYQSRRWKDRNDEFRADWIAGMPAKDMAEKFKRTYSAILAHAHDMDLPPRLIRGPPLPKRTPAPVLTDWPDDIAFQDDPQADGVGKPIRIRARRYRMVI